MSEYWTHVSKADGRARALADRHYNRQHVGATMFTPPGNTIVLIVRDGDFGARAVWASHRPDPNAGIAERLDGFDYWNNSLFRNESDIRSSDLIREAVAITVGIWGKPFARDGFHTFVDPRFVHPTMRHGEKIYGYSYLKAGFTLYPERTKSNALWRWVLTPDDLEMIEPIMPKYEQLRLFA